MKKLLLILLFSLTFLVKGWSQTNFQSETDVLSYLDGKNFKNADGSISVKIGYSSSINSYGIILNGSTTHFNLSIMVLSPTRALVSGESLTNPDGVLKIRVNSTTGCLENEGAYFCK